MSMYVDKFHQTIASADLRAVGLYKKNYQNYKANLVLYDCLPQFNAILIYFIDKCIARSKSSSKRQVRTFYKEIRTASKAYVTQKAGNQHLIPNERVI